MKKILLILCIVCVFVAASCSKEKEKETDQLANTTWKSGKYNHNTVSAFAYGIVYYGDYYYLCHELLEFTESGCVWRYITYCGEKVNLEGFCDYKINGNEIVIVDDTNHTYKLTNKDTITKFFMSGEEDGYFVKIK
jgi:hypothetical protein